jgi:hypothetical protein
MEHFSMRQYDRPSELSRNSPLHRKELTNPLIFSGPHLVSSISLFDGLPIAEIDGLPASASRLL